jgi:hypothetical protein
MSIQTDTPRIPDGEARIAPSGVFANSKSRPTGVPGNRKQSGRSTVIVRYWNGPVAFPTALAFNGKRRSAGEAAMKPKIESNTVSLAVIGVDIGKEVFYIVG